MEIAEIKEYAHIIAEYIKNYREVCREQGGDEEHIPTTPLQNDIEHLVSMLDQLDEPTMSRHSATFLTCRITDELDVPSSVAEKIEQKLMSGKFEEVEQYYVERKKWLAENRAL